MAYLMKRDRTKSFFKLEHGKRIRFFCLDFQCQKFYYKEKQNSPNIRFICSFNQIAGICQFIVEKPPKLQELKSKNIKEPESEDQQNDTLENEKRLEDIRDEDSADEIKTEKELEEERKIKWNFGLEVYYKNRKNASKREH